MSSAGETLTPESTAVASVAKSDPAVDSVAEKSAEPVVEKSESGNHVAVDGDAPAVKKAKIENESNGSVKEKSAKKKVSQLERTRAEAEALIGDLKKVSEESGGRRTRSQTRGTPPKSVVPEKQTRSPRAAKAKSESPVAAAPSPKKTAASGRSRGRTAKKAVAAASDDEVTDKADPAEAAEPESEKAEVVQKTVIENGQTDSESKSSEMEDAKEDAVAVNKDAAKAADVTESPAKSDSDTKSGAEVAAPTSDAPAADPVAQKTE